MKREGERESESERERERERERGRERERYVTYVLQQKLQSNISQRCNAHSCNTFTVAATSKAQNAVCALDSAV